MINYSRCREKMEGRRGRRRTYRCRKCQTKFRVDLLRPLPIKERICPDCKKVGAECQSLGRIHTDTQY